MIKNHFKKSSRSLEISFWKNFIDKKNFLEKIFTEKKVWKSALWKINNFGTYTLIFLFWKIFSLLF